MSTKYYVEAIKNTFVEIESRDLSKSDAIETALELAKDYPDHQVFVGFNGGYLNQDGNHNVVGKAWICDD